MKILLIFFIGTSIMNKKESYVKFKEYILCLSHPLVQVQVKEIQKEELKEELQKILEIEKLKDQIKKLEEELKKEKAKQVESFIWGMTAGISISTIILLLIGMGMQ